MSATISQNIKRNFLPPVMLDVVIALLPLAVIAYWAYGILSLIVIGSSLLGAIISDFLFSFLLLKKKNTLYNGSAIITGLLLAYTLSPLTPWYIALFGGAAAVLFGKILWGGINRNVFNPALVGREFMTVFFASVMTGSEIWSTKSVLEHTNINLFDNYLLPSASAYLSKIIYNGAGALGEYSALALILGGLYLIIRKRISWHIPFGVLAFITALVWIFPDGETIRFSLGGVLLGTIFMATDLPTSPSNNNGKLYYGLILGLVVILLIRGGVSFAYMSYSILILNGFSKKITEVFRSNTAKHTVDMTKRVEYIALLTLQILAVTLAVLTLHYYRYEHYLLYFFIIYLIFNFTFNNKVQKA